MKIELIWASPPFGFFLTAEISVIMSSEIRLVHFDQHPRPVVFLAVGDQAVIVLLLEFLGERTGVLHDLPLRCRHHHVVPCRTKYRP